MALRSNPPKSLIQKKIIFILLALILLPAKLPGQEPPQLELRLDKENISWIWVGNLSYKTQTWRQSSLQIDNRFSSNLYSETSRENKWKDENNFKMSWTNPISNVIEARTFFDSRVFSDENTTTKFNKHLAAQEVNIRLYPKIRLTPAVGWTVEEVFDRQDQGWYSKLGLKINKLDMGSYLNTTDVNSEIRGFPGRKNQEHTFFTSWNKRFSEQAGDSLRVGYQFSDKKYYLARQSENGETANDLEQVTINARFLSNQLNYYTGKISRFSVLTEFKNRSINQTNPELQNHRKEIFVSNQLNYLSKWGPLGFDLGMMFSQTINDNPGENTDIDGLQAALSGKLEFRPIRQAVLWNRFSYTKYEYNTPESNNDDRDEQRFIIDSGYKHRFSPYFELKLKSQVYLYHQIFLSAERSANNNWNRIYQLAAGFNYRLSGIIRHQNQLKILANYTAFDFDEILPKIRSYVFRKLTYTDSLSIKLAENLFLNSIYQWENEDNGTFFKEEFSQRISKEINSHFLNIALQRQKIWGFHLTTGIAFYWRDEWNFIPTKDKAREFRSISPRMSIVYPASKRLLLLATYAPNRTTELDENPQYFTTGKLDMQYFF